MKKILLAGLALLCASGAYAQSQTTTTTFSTAQQLNGVKTDGSTGCLLTGITSLTVDNSAGTITTNGVGCGVTIPTDVITATPTSQTYTIGSTTAAPAYTWSSSQAGTTCTFSNASSQGFSVTSAPNAGGNGGTLTLSTPPVVTAPTSYSFSLSCTAPSGYQLSYSTSSVSLTVAPKQVIGNNIDCVNGSSSYTVPVGGKQLSRMCSGTVGYGNGSKFRAPYVGQLNDITGVLGTSNPGTWMGMYSGYALTFSIPANQYVALKFTVTEPGTIQLGTNSSFGIGGAISVSQNAPALSLTDPNVVGSCTYGGGASNNLYATTSAGSSCPLEVNKTYYLNFAGVDYDGNTLCFNGAANTCASSTISYTELVSKTSN